MTKLEQFSDAWSELSRDEKISIYRDYQREIGDEEEWYDFDEMFFETFFTNAMEAVRAWHFGGYNSWSNKYIKFNAYGNLKTANEYQVAEEADGMVDEIFEYPNVWEEYITIEDEDEEDED